MTRLAFVPLALPALACALTAALACAPPPAVEPVLVKVDPLAADVVRAVEAEGVVVVERAGVAVLGAAATLPGTLLDAATFAGQGLFALSSGLFVLDAAAESGLAPAPLGASFAEAPTILEVCGEALYLVSGDRLFRSVESPAPELLELDVGFAGGEAAGVASATCGTRAGAPVLVVLVAVGSNPRSVVELDTSRAPAATFRGEALEAFAAARIGEAAWVFASAALLEIEDGRPEVGDGTGARNTLAAPVQVFAADATAAWLDVDGALHRGGADDGVLRAAEGAIGAPAALFASGDGSALVVDVDGALSRVHL